MTTRRSFLSALAAGFAALKVGKAEPPFGTDTLIGPAVETPLGDCEIEVVQPWVDYTELYHDRMFYAADGPETRLVYFSKLAE